MRGVSRRQSFNAQPWKTDPVWTIYDFNERKDKIVLDPEYQRSNVWKPKKQLLLIDSILRGWEIGQILLNATSQEREGGGFEPLYEVIDGQQRLRAIYKFLDGKLAFHQFTKGTNNVGVYRILREDYDLRGKKWTADDFPQKVKTKFYTHNITVKVYLNKKEPEVAKIFARVQEGLPLSSSEKLNAILGYIRNGIRDLSKHELLQNIKISSHRFNHRWIVSHIVYHEINNFTEREFRKAHYTDLRNMYNQHSEKRRESIEALRRVKRTFGYLNKHLGKNASLLEKNPDFITLCLVCSYLFRKNYVIEGVKQLNWSHFVETFLLKVADAKKRFKEAPEGESLPADLAPYYRYETNRRREGKKEIKERFEFMIEKFLEMFPTLNRKDKQRLFDEYQKRLVYKRANHRCQDPQDSKCAGETTYDGGEADHIKPWSLGNPTSIENGQWLCKHCNRVKYTKM